MLPQAIDVVDADVIYAVTGSDGITFNHAPVNASTVYYNGEHIDELTLDGLFDGQHLTLDGPPYCGFAVQKLIRGRT